MGPFLRKHRELLVTALLLALPTALWYLLFLIAPLVVLVVMSVGERSPNGGYAPAMTLQQYAALPTRFTPLVNTLGLAALNTVICALVAFPVAYTLALKVRGTWKLVLVALVIVPFWTSFLIRTYAWMTLLGGNGIPRILGWIGFENIQLLNTPFAVSLGIVYNYLPLMVLPIYVSLERLDRSYIEASRDLGAGPIALHDPAWTPVVWPGANPGVPARRFSRRDSANDGAAKMALDRGRRLSYRWRSSARPRSSSGLGHQPLTLVTGVRVPYGAPFVKIQNNFN